MNKINKSLVKEISKLMEEFGLSEFEFSDSNNTYKLKKNANPKIDIEQYSNQSSFKKESQEEGNQDNIIKAPLVGTVYLAPEPGSKTFIDIGQTVKIGQVLLIIEAMKTMNEVTASKSGTVKKIFIENQTPVEFGEPLILIE
ncbi:MAG: acetyl-CoA carboxylase biotin carboxyl carrier protein subunit [Rickettsiales bacterium]|nr:acetyl-CoA carboxylase biotin carboxyl carrier protein subunit [Rickettsiales bacterium]|tara:strand:- start:322 stop:747 length:426 start_codon:yes stop_codon:yes gene_type:complete